MKYLTLNDIHSIKILSVGSYSKSYIYIHGYNVHVAAHHRDFYSFFNHTTSFTHFFFFRTQCLRTFVYFRFIFGKYVIPLNLFPLFFVILTSTFLHRLSRDFNLRSRRILISTFNNCIYSCAY